MKDHKFRVGKIAIFSTLVIVVAVLFCYWMAFHFSKNVEQMEVNNLRALSEKADRLLFDENIYLKPDTAYFCKLEQLLREGYFGINIPEQRSFVGLLANNQRKAAQYDSNMHTVYVALEDESAKYVLVNGGIRQKDQLRDMDWITTVQEMNTDCYLDWRQVSTSFLNQVDLITLYRIYDSVSYNDGSIIRGYIVVNYYRKHLLNEISVMASNEENVIFYNARTGELLPMKDSELSQEWLRSLVNKCLDTELQCSGTESSASGNMIYHFSKSEYSDLYYLSLKADTQVSEFMSEIFLIFIMIALLISVAIIIILIAYYLQRSKYLNGLVQIISATESDQTMEENMMVMLSEDFKEREMDVAIIAKKILEDNVDIHELRKAVISEHQLRTEVEMLYGYAQINSHFLLNTLDSIYWKSVANNGMENEETMMVERLCVILKYALDSSNPYISLEEEIECANDYLAIQSFRKKQKLEVEWKIPDMLKTAKVGKLMLQPILENSIQHGSVNLEEPLHLCIEAKLDLDNLCIRISDNGSGMSNSEMERMNETFREDQPVRSKHIGLMNVNRRIQLQYGKGYGIELKENQNGTGLTVIMRLKYLIMQENEGGSIL